MVMLMQILYLIWIIIFIRMGEMCIVTSGVTAPPTGPQIPTTSPTPAPSSAPTNSESGPNLWECRFEDHGTALMMQFDKETNRVDRVR